MDTNLVAGYPRFSMQRGLGATYQNRTAERLWEEIIAAGLQAANNIPITVKRHIGNGN
jgi:hypothetical protein